MAGNSDPVVIVGAARTPLGRFQGALAGVSAPDLGATAVRAAWRRAGIKPQEVDEVLMGCVLSAGLGQAPARQAALAAGIPDSAGCTTVTAFTQTFSVGESSRSSPTSSDMKILAS